MTNTSTKAQDNGKNKHKDNDEIPSNFVAKLWVGIYRSLPVIHFPFTKLNISMSLLGATFLWTCRIISYHILVRIFGWPSDNQKSHEAVGSIIAILHSTSILPGLAVALASQPYRPSSHITTAPQWWQHLVSALMQFCTGYMVYDSLASFLILKGPSNLVASDFLFLGHHFATSLYMTQTRVLQAGHTSAMICMFLGELTNPFQNSYYVSQHAMEFECCSGPWMQQFHDFVAMGFAYSYFCMRVIIAPLFFVHVTGDLLLSKTRTNIPVLIRFFWIFMIWAVEVGSYDWIMQCWTMIQQFQGISGTTEGADDKNTATTTQAGAEL